MHEQQTDRQSTNDKSIRFLDNSPSLDTLDDPMRRYNYVISSYNSIEGTKGIKLKLMNESSIYRSFWKTLNQSCLMFVLVLLQAVPGLGLVLYLWILTGVLIYFSGLSVFIKNKKQISDPFNQMVFSPEICSEEQSLTKYCHIKVHELKEFHLNEEVENNLKLNQSEGHVRFMAYDGRFWDFYHNYPKYEWRHICILFISTIFLAAGGFISLLIYQKFIKQ